MMTLITVKKIQTQIIYRFAFDLKFVNKNIPIYLTTDSFYVHEKRIFFNEKSSSEVSSSCKPAMFFVEMLRKSPKNALYKYIHDTNVLPYF